MSVDPRAYYDTFSVSYNRRRRRGYHALIDEIEAGMIPAESSLRILEVGCGTGLVMQRLRDRGAAGLFGIDLSSGMLSAARREDHRVAQASATALPFADGTFDIAFSFKVLAHVPDITTALAEIARVVRPGGTIVVEFYNRHSLRGLRWGVKRVIGGESTGEAQRETELFTRYDSVRDMLSYAPPTTRLEAIRGAMVMTPAAVALEIPGIASLLRIVERRAARSPLARYAGFAILVLKRL